MPRFWLTAVFLVGCAPLTPPKVTVPANVTCDRTFVVTDDLAAPLSRAEPGDCVLLPAGVYQGNFEVEADVSLLAGEGEQVTLAPMESSRAVLTVTGGRRTVLRGFRIDVGGGPGLIIEPGPVQLVGVSITGAATALTVRCQQDDCGTRPSTLEALEVAQSGVGVLVDGATLSLSSSVLRDNSGSRLSDGVGLYALRGAQLSMDQVEVRKNQTAGLIVDGATTRATLVGVTIAENLGRGLWAQGTRGERTVVGTNLNAPSNALVGVGAVDAEGVVLEDVSISDTRAVQVPIDIARRVPVGDGLGLFERVVGAQVTRLSATGNARAQLMVDSVADGGLTTAQLTLSGGQYRAVVQNSGALDVEAMLLDVPDAGLLVVDEAVPLP